MNRRLRQIVGGTLVVLALGAQLAGAITTTWKGTANGDWFNTNNWTGLAVPAAGDDVVVTNTSILLTNSTANLSSFVITNATVTFTNWNTAINATNVTIRNLGKFNCAACNTNGAPGNTNRVYIVGSNLTIEVGGSINVNGLGFAGSTTSVRGQGPGGGYAGEDGGGGGYGGAGGGGEGESNGGPAAGTPNDASLPGSGGGGSTRNGNAGGAGGGAVYLDLDGTLTLRGSIAANGTNGGTSAHSGCGSGGGIVVQCDTFSAFAGSSIVADGGTGQSGCFSGGGGGGRILISCAQVAAGSAVYLSTDYGVRAPGGLGNPGSIGSVNVPSTALLPETGRLNGVVWGIGAWNPSQLNFINSHLGLGTPGLVLTVTNDMVLGTNSSFEATLSNCVLSVGGNLTLTNSAPMTLRSVSTNATGAYTNFGGRLSVGGTFAVNAGSTVTLVPMRDDSGALKCEVGNLTVAAGGTIHADYLGCVGALTVNTKGSGTGGGGAGGSGYGGGAGHGGTGGNAQSGGVGGIAYGNSNAPVRCGSGGGSRTGASNQGYGDGGGVVWVQSPGIIHVDGTVSAKGEPGYNHNGSGSGGSIYLTCDTFEGGASGSLSARGGDIINALPYSNTHGGAGGGGRIAIYRRTDTFTGQVTAGGGAGYSGGGYAGATGTVVRTTDPNVTYVFLTVAASPAVQRDTPSPFYGVNGFTQGSFITNSVTSPADESNGVRYACMGWTLTNDLGLYESGVTTQKVVEMATNATLTWIWTNVYQLTTLAATNGSLQADCSGWYTNATQVSVTAIPNSGYYFLQWSGDWPPNSWTSNPLTVTMDQPRTLIAHFASNTPGSKVWSGTGNWYSNFANWNPPGAPGTGDTVVVGAGTATLTDPMTVQSLTITNTGVVQARGALARYDLTVQGSVFLSGSSAALTVTNANLLVGGNLSLTNGGTLRLGSGPTNGVAPEYGGLLGVTGSIGVASVSTIYLSSDPTNGGSTKILAGNVVLNGGKINADAAGWQGGTASHTEGYGPGHGHFGTYGGGAGYGGDGGDALLHSGSKGVAYGTNTVPTLPGSGGGYNATTANGSGRGGGLIWLVTPGAVTLGGTMTANGGDGQPHNGAGSGGGIYIECDTLAGDASGWLKAKGGGVPGTNPGGGNGAGGRIAVRLMHLRWSYTNQVDVSGGTNGTQTYMYGGDGTVYWNITAPPGTIVLVR